MKQTDICGDGMLRILTFFGDGGVHAGRVSNGPGYQMRFSDFFFDDIVEPARDRPGISLRETPFRWTLDAIRSGGYHAIKCDGNDAFLLHNVLAANGVPKPPMLIVENDFFSKTDSMRPAFKEYFDGDRFSEMLADDTNHWLYIASGKRSYYVDRGIPEANLYYFPICIETIAFPFPDIRSAVSEEPTADSALAREVRGKILAVGTHERDYETLLKAVRGIDTETHIICETRLYPPQPQKNVVWHNSVPMADFVSALRAAAVVVIPLRSVERNFGQLGAAIPMHLGKAILATRAASLEDHIEHGKTGWFVEPGSEENLHAALETLLADDALRSRLGTAAREREAALSEIGAQTIRNVLERVSRLNGLRLETA